MVNFSPTSLTILSGIYFSTFLQRIGIFETHYIQSMAKPIIISINAKNPKLFSESGSAEPIQAEKCEESCDIVKIFERRRKIRSHGCKYLPLIGPSSLSLNCQQKS